MTSLSLTTYNEVMATHKKILQLFTGPTFPSLKGIDFLSTFGKKKEKRHLHLKKHRPSIQTISHKDNQLIILRNPTAEEVAHLKKHYNFHPIHLEDIISTIQRPKIDEEENYIFLVFHFPQFNHKTKKIESKEVDFFLTEQRLVVVIDEEFRLIENIIEKIAINQTVKEEYFKKGSGMLLYLIIDSLVDSIFPIIDKIERGLEIIDKEVFSADPKNITEDLFFLRRNVIFLQSLVKPELNSFIEIEEQSTHPFIHKELKTYFSNITDHLKKIWDRLEDVRELSDNLSQTFESYISFKTNETIKVLTIFSVVLLPLTLISGIYGMNLSFLPIAEHPQAIFIITFGMIGIVVLMLSFFKSKHWI